MKNFNYDQETPVVKERNGFVSFWLGLVLLSNIVAGIRTIRLGLAVQIEGGLGIYVIIAGIMALVAVYGAGKILTWKKIGFYLILGAAVVKVALMLVVALQGGSSTYAMFITYALIALLSPLILFGILQIRKNGHSCWSLLE